VPEAFDPYHRWLGIPPAEQPANHYRLLGLSLFESDPEVIRDAASQRMAHVRTYQLGPNSALSQRILNELGAAKACLLDPGEKAAYDAKLRATLSGPEEIRRPDPLADLFGDIPESGPPVVLSPIRRQRRLPQPALIGAGVAIGLLILLGLVVWGLRSPKTPEVAGPDEGGPTKTSSTTAKQATGEPAKPPQPEIPVSTTGGPPEVAKVPVTAPIAPPPAPVPPPPLAVAPFSDAEAKEHQRRWAEYLKVPVETTNSIGMKLVLIPPGEFVMGSTTDLIEEQLRWNDAWYNERVPGEAPRHRVRITEPFYLGATEVTQEEYLRVTGVNPSNFQGDPKRPVEQVSWNDAVEFCRRLSELAAEKEAKRRYQLPTEAQWEHACRAGNVGPWFFSPPSGQLGGEWGVKRCDEYGWSAGKETHPVRQKRANPFGLYDVYGNVWEWCRDWYGKDYYAKSATDDPVGPERGFDRVRRGGSWTIGAGACRSADRDHFPPSTRLLDLGFRVLVTCPASPADAAKVPESTPAPPPLAVAPFDAKKAREHQEAWAKHLGVPVETTNSIGMKLVLIPAGVFVMGWPDTDRDARPAEKPQHEVRITKPFYLGKYEVTQEQWRAVMGNNRSMFKSPKNPVEQVTWDDCQAFLEKLNAKHGGGGKFPLPTEAQWEYACRAGSTTRCYFGDGEGSLGEYAWYNGNSGGKTHPVGEKKPNTWGLYDMHGNVLEWCADWYGGYANSSLEDPTGPVGGSGRVCRGGGCTYAAWYCRSAARFIGGSGYRHYSLGLRVSRVVAE